VHPVYRVHRPRGGGGSPVHRGSGGDAGGTPHRSGVRGWLRAWLLAMRAPRGRGGARGTSPWLAVGGTGMERGWQQASTAVAICSQRQEAWGGERRRLEQIWTRWTVVEG
jgi:hypothetical protein